MIYGKDELQDGKCQVKDLGHLWRPCGYKPLNISVKKIQVDKCMQNAISDVGASIGPRQTSQVR